MCSMDRVIIIAEDIDLRVMKALQYAKTISDTITVFGVATEEKDDKDRFMVWAGMDTGVPYVLRFSPDGGIVDPLLDFIQSAEYGYWPDETVTVILPRLVENNWWHRLLDNHVSKYIERRLSQHKQIIVKILPIYPNDERPALACNSSFIWP